MSDGPHRTLPMNRQWKACARRAEIRAFGVEDVAESGQIALLATLRRELPRPFRREVAQCLASRQISINGTSDAVTLLERLQNSPQEGRLRGLLIEHAILVSEAGTTGEHALQQALQRVTADEVARRQRQIDEHYLQRSWPGTSSALRRVATALDAIDPTLVARTLAGPKNDSGSRRPASKAGLDDGVPVLRTEP